eukprot:Transcript_29531.p3 GENE.Transcript_29531~~Transcript_29531.p3  ORF type:complete len:246 (+),score=80.11 Transcript_29531:311-1048(+)
MLRECSSLQVAAVCRQLRCRDCQQCTVALHTLGVALEACVGMQFARWDTTYPGFAQHFAAAGFHPNGRNRWQQVYDFTPPPPGERRGGARSGEIGGGAESGEEGEEGEGGDPATCNNWRLLPEGAGAAVWRAAEIEAKLRARGVANLLEGSASPLAAPPGEAVPGGGPGEIAISSSSASPRYSSPSPQLPPPQPALLPLPATAFSPRALPASAVAAAQRRMREVIAAQRGGAPEAEAGPPQPDSD